jgi:hypothetical protein
MRTLFGVGTPRSLQGRAVALFIVVWWLIRAPETLSKAIGTGCRRIVVSRNLLAGRRPASVNSSFASAFTTGC